MTLYESLAPAYDALFPLDPRSTDFLASLFPGQAGVDGLRVLDAGCATGAHALALAARGWTAVGIDSEGAMIAAARERALREGLSDRAAFLVADLLGIGERFGPSSGQEGFDLALCLGNTLPHLDGPGAASFLSQARALLRPGGAIVLQTLNFSLPAVGPGYAFPEIAAGGAVMRRRYEAPPSDRRDCLRFVVELERSGETRVGDALLQPMFPRQVGELLDGAGFRESDRYPGWGGGLFEEGRDLFCVTVARA